MKSYLIISISILSFILHLWLQSCNMHNVKSNKPMISLDSLYMNALKYALKGKCFYNPPPPIKDSKKELNEITNDNKVKKLYYYFHNEFIDFLIDSTTEFYEKDLNTSLKEANAVLQVDTILLKNTENISFKRADEFLDNISITNFEYFGYDILDKHPDFNGFIIFSKPLVLRISDERIEYFIRVMKEIDSPRNCYIKLTVFNMKIINIQELKYKEGMLFR